MSVPGGDQGAFPVMEVYAIGLRGRVEQIPVGVHVTPMFGEIQVLPTKWTETKGEVSLTWHRVPEDVRVDRVRFNFQTSEVTLYTDTIMGNGGDITFEANIVYANE